MKRNATNTLIKDIITAILTWFIFAVITNNIYGGDLFSLNNMEANVLATVFAGIPFGWRWASKLITAVSIKGIGIKLGIAFFLGWFAIYVVLIGDIIRCITSSAAEKKQARKVLESA